MGGLYSKFKVLRDRCLRLNPRHVVPDTFIIVFSLYASLLIRVGFADFGRYLSVVDRYAFFFLALRLSVFALFGAYDIIWRFISLRDCVRIFNAALLSSTLIFVTSYLVDIGHLPRAVFLIDTMLVTILLAGIRFARRLAYESSMKKEGEQSKKYVLVYGAGSMGRFIANRLSADTASGRFLAGFLDDDPEKIGRFVAGYKVVGAKKELASMIEKMQVKEVYVAISHPPAELLREILKTCTKSKVRARLVSRLSETSSEGRKVQTFRDIELRDLLRRPQRVPQNKEIRDLIRGKRVLVTGAGGSIGSELARQILGFGPASLLLLDHSEFNLYQIDSELREVAADSDLLKPILVDIKDYGLLSTVFEQYRPEVVFHAAAYKHVHLVESNPFPAILNNIAGTLHLLELSEQSGVMTFVMISTDKAVNPAGVMGATKRVCEMLVSETGARTQNGYCSVRFGNVLGSSGSLVPLLSRQIERGEPLTITHEDMSRYFMLIPEAVSLVLRAATLAEPSDITILRMGEPVKIVDLARSLIALMGKSESEVPVVFTGVRPGEKLCEELYLCGNELNTADPDVLILPKGDGSQPGVGLGQLRSDVRELIDLARASNPRALFLLNSLIENGTKSQDVSWSSEEIPPPFKPRPYSTNEPMLQ